MDKRVHVTVSESVQMNPPALDEIREVLESKFGMTQMNDRQFRRHGILTGTIDAEKVKEISACQGVESVEIAEERVAS